MTVDDLWSEDWETEDTDRLPARDVLSRIADRWTIRVMRALQECGALRYTALEDEVPGVSRKMLTQTLRAIERDGMVHREVFPGLPPHVEYSLTDLGRTALGPIDILYAWSREHMSEVSSARRRYDASGAADRAATATATATATTTATARPGVARAAAETSAGLRGVRPRPLLRRR